MEVSQDIMSRKVEISLMHLDRTNAKGVRQGFYQTGVIARNIVKRNISALPRFGNVNYYKGRKRRASVAGESFANRSRDAQNTLGFDVRGSDQLEVGFRKNSKTEYVKLLEEGTSRMKKRPTLEIMNKEVVGIAQNTLLLEIAKAHRESVK